MRYRGTWSPVVLLFLCLLLGARHATASSPDSYEPNGKREEAPFIATETPLFATLFPVGDQDYYRVPIATGLPLQLDIALDDVASNFNPHLTLFDAKGTEIFRHEVAPGQPMRCRVNLADPGSLTIRLVDSCHGIGEVGYSHEWNNQAATQPYRLSVQATPMPDSAEPNNTAETAFPLSLNQDFRGRLFPARDEDWYKVDIPAGKRGLLKVVFSHPSDLIQPHALLRNSSGQDIDASSVSRGEQAVLLAEVSSGTYRFRFIDGNQGKHEVGYSHEWGNQASTQEYQGSVQFLEVVDQYEPSSKDEPATFTLNTEVSASLFPRGETDFYAFEIPAPGVGVLQIEADCSLAPVVPVLRLLKSSGEEVTRATGAEGGLAKLTTHLRSPGRFIVELFDSNTGTWEVGYSHETANRTGPYKLRINFTPIIDSDDPHQSYETALELPQGTSVSSTLFPAGEQEYFRCTVPGSGPTAFEFSIPDLDFPIAPQCVRMDAPGQDTQHFRVGVYQPISERLILQAPGSYTFRVLDGNHGLHEVGYSHEIANQCSRQPYHVFWRVSPPRPEPLASSVIPLKEHDTATAAVAVAMPASCSFFLYPAGDQEWLLLPQTGPGLLEGRFDATDQRLNPRVAVFTSATDTSKPFSEVDNSYSSIEHFRVRLPFRSNWLLRVTAATGSSSNPIHAQLWMHDLNETGPEAAGIPLEVANLQQGLSGRIFPAGDSDAFQLTLPSAGTLHVSGFEPDGISLNTTFSAIASPALRVLYLVGGRTDYSLFNQTSGQVVAKRLQEESLEYLRHFPFYSTYARGDCPPPIGATQSFHLQIPAGMQAGRLYVTAFGMDPNVVRFTCNQQPLKGTRISAWGQWAEVAYEIASL
ncbi:MAG TPA: hypothetical protein PKO06_01405, partial [Candidatus Ozemobacteraceae bacterium]|nr:hypothetical protein [Candidatus Ozemobacteraceae bacterium]